VVAFGRHLGDHRADPGEVGVTGIGRGRVDADEDHLRALQQLVHVGGETKALPVLFDQLGQARLVDGDLAATERVNLVLEQVPGDHRVPQFGEAGGGHQTDPADSDHTNRTFFVNAHQ